MHNGGRRSNLRNLLKRYESLGRPRQSALPARLLLFRVHPPVGSSEHEVSNVWKALPASPGVDRAVPYRARSEVAGPIACG